MKGIKLLNCNNVRDVVHDNAVKKHFELEDMKIFLRFNKCPKMTKNQERDQIRISDGL